MKNRWFFGSKQGTILCVIGSLLLSMLMTEQAEARRKKKRRVVKSKTVSVSADHLTAVNGLMGNLKWGMTLDQVKAGVTKKIRDSYVAQRSKLSDPIDQDRLRKAEERDVSALTKSYYTFSGARSPWDVSLIEKEFAHRNDESVLVVWEKKERRFYFFHNERLWKIYIAFNSEVYADKTFDDFAAAMEARFGAAERKYRTNLKGEAEESHLEWPAFGKTVLKAIDNTGFYGNFCLVLQDSQKASAVTASRKAKKANGRVHSADHLIDMVTDPTKGPDKDLRANENIVDQLTGTHSKTPVTTEKNTKDAAAK